LPCLEARYTIKAQQQELELEDSNKQQAVEERFTHVLVSSAADDQANRRVMGLAYTVGTYGECVVYQIRYSLQGKTCVVPF
jgi:hypothetical protein